MLEATLAGTAARKVNTFTTIPYNLARESFGVEEKKVNIKSAHQPSRREREIHRLRGEIKTPTKQFKRAPAVEKEGQNAVDILFDFVELFDGPHLSYAVLNSSNVTLLVFMAGADSVRPTEVALVEASSPNSYNGTLKEVALGLFMATINSVPAGEFVVRTQADGTLVPGKNFTVTFTVATTGSGGVFNITVSNDRSFVMTNVPSSLTLARGGSANGTVTLAVPRNTTSGSDVTFDVLRLSVVALVTDITPPGCKVVRVNANCSANCMLSSWDLSANMTDGNGSGIQSVTIRQGNGSFSTSTVLDRGANSDDTEPRVDQRPNNSGHDGTCLDPRGKRKKSSSGSSHRKRQRVEVEDTETEDQQVLPTTADGEEGQPSWFVSSDEESPEGQSETYCAPEESQSDQEAKSDHGESEDEELDYDIILREELDRKYVQLYRLGEGGFGSVYAGYRRDDLLPVAVKHIPQNKVRRINVVLDGEQVTYPLEVLLLCMVQEGEAVSRQTRGASVALLDWCELQDKLVIVMERPEPSKDLTDYVYDSGGYLLEEEGKVILRQLVEGMIDIHSKGVLHRDIKPENILIQMDPEGLQVYILDFGCGNVLTEDPYTSYYGTPEYTPPECFLGGSYQAEPCTVWQIGVVLFFMLIGHLPFYTSEEIISEEPDIQGQLSQECEDLLRSCLDKRSESRPSLQDILQHPWLQ
ncbi:hypothetical protein AOLI_G00017510 [Acnodon oligacanthus]